MISDLTIPASHSLVSFDVKSLFTSIPHNLALESVKNAIEDDDKILERTLMGPPEIMSLLNLCLKANVLKANDKIFRQIKGLPMGSPVSVVVAELTMQQIEKLIFRNPLCQPLFWKRYVDDCFTALPTE